MNFSFKSILFILFFVLHFTIQCEEKCIIKNNFEMLDTVMYLAISEVKTKLQMSELQVPVCFNISNNEADFLVEKNFLKVRNNEDFPNNFFQKNAYCEANSIKIVIEKIDVNFQKMKSNKDSVYRNSNVKLFVLVSDKNSFVSSYEIAKSIQDTLNYNDLEEVNRTNFSFAKTEIPQKDLTIWNKYFEPVIVVVSAAIVTTLFFTVRSK